jgi:hypothetical protein
MMPNEIIVSGFTAPEELRAIEGAISILKTMGMLAKFPQEDCENFVRACAVMKANPILKEVHPVPYWNADLKRNVLGIIPDYKTYLSRAERSGNLDGWETEFRGDVVKRSVTKKGNRKDGSSYEYVAELVDKEKSTLEGRITIWRKDQSHPFKSRWLRLVNEMKDTPFWHDDPDGMLEKNLIREFFQKIFPKDCDLADYSKEVHAAEFEGLDADSSTTPTTPQATPIAIAQAVKACNDMMMQFSLVSSHKEEIDARIKEAAKNGDIGELDGIRDELTALKAKAEASSKPKAKKEKAETVTDAEFTPVDNTELNKARADIVNAFGILAKEKVDRFDQPNRKIESMKKHLDGCDDLSKCTDIQKMKEYQEHLRDKYRNKDKPSLQEQARKAVEALPVSHVEKEQAAGCLDEAEQVFADTGDENGYAVIVEKWGK